MKIGARNYNTNYARNTGLAKTSPTIAKKELIKSSQVGDKAFYLNSFDLVLHKYTTKGRYCSCMNYSSPEQEMYAEDSDIDTPVIILGEEDNIEDDIALDRALELLENPKDVCPICYGTSIVGNYKSTNCVELFMDSTYPNKVMDGVDIREGKPFYFQPLKKDSSILFTIQVPGFYDAMQRFSIMTKDSLVHNNMVVDNVEIGAYGGPLSPFKDYDIESTARYSKLNIKIPVTEPTIAFFMRFELGRPTIKVNFPNIPSEIESGEHDYFSSITASVDSTLKISTRDLLADRQRNILWRVTSVEKKEPMDIDLGKEVSMRKVRGFEAYALIP